MKALHDALRKATTRKLVGVNVAAEKTPNTTAAPGETLHAMATRNTSQCVVTLAAGGVAAYYTIHIGPRKRSPMLASGRN